jgi:hypothetical protein
MLVEQTKRYKYLKTYLDSTSDMLPIWKSGNRTSNYLSN